jgi:hypothetical protein
MAYSDFTLKKAKEKFNLTIREVEEIFGEAPEVAPGPGLQLLLADYENLAININTEKARSELLVAPILVDARRHLNNQISLFSGIDFNVAPEVGLSGYCDYMISLNPIQQYLSAPIIAIAEAKNDNPLNGLGQCVAEMVAARLFNEREGNSVKVIYGVSTTGTAWRFLKLEGSQVLLDKSDYYIKEVEKILGILTYIASHEV